jgi:hypothetical protein
VKPPMRPRVPTASQCVPDAVARSASPRPMRLYRDAWTHPQWDMRQPQRVPPEARPQPEPVAWPSTCPNCGSRDILVRQSDGAWRCEDCGAASQSWPGERRAALEALRAMVHRLMHAKDWPTGCDQVVTTHRETAGSRLLFVHVWDHQSHAHIARRCRL